tara:strand:- start:16524 stop:17474 length:951 start_codon:yes stop_codon:yes gene_type:complete
MATRPNKSKPSDLSNLSVNGKNKLSNSTLSESVGSEGIANDKKVEPIPTFRKAPSEDIVANGQNNAQIIVGRDRPSTLASGYGGRGDTHAGSIDIVAGRVAASAKETDDNNEKSFVDPNFQKDSARIHISQKTDIDKNFNLADGKVGNSIARSGIGIKGDSVRIISREGIKLVTQTESKNSLGGDILSTKGIDLIAGNDDSDLQPLVKGNNLVKLLRNIVEDIRTLNGLVNSLATKQVALDATLAAHTHITACGVGPGLAAPSIELAVAATADAVQLSAMDFPSHISVATNSITSEIDYLKPCGSKYIISKYNNTN